MHLKILTAKWPPFCPGGDELTKHWFHWWFDAKACYNELLTHWGRVTHICVGNLTIIVSDNGLSPGRHQAIIWTNAVRERPLNLITHSLNQCWNIVDWTLGNKLQWNFNRNSYIFIQENPFETVVWKWRPFCLGLNVLMGLLSRYPLM